MSFSSKNVCHILQSALVCAVALCIAPPGLADQALTCDKLQALFARAREQAPRASFLRELTQAKWTVRRWPPEKRVGCLKALGDLHRDIGSYQAEELYKEALELAPENPEILEAIGRYYRLFRGSKGLFGEAEAYYVHAESAVQAALEAAEAAPEERRYLGDLQERIIRGRIDLNKREGLGLWIPHRPEGRLGLFLGTTFENGEFPVAHNDLATPAITLRNLDPSFDTRQMLRQQEFRRQRTWLRLRTGLRPSWEVAWTTVDGANVIASQRLPVEFAGLEVEQVELGVEDTVNLAPAADLLWRIELQDGSFDVKGPAEEKFQRVVASTTWTRSLGRVKADLQFLGAFSSVELGSGETDEDSLAGVNLRLVHFRPRWTTEGRPIDPRGYEYLVGFVTRTRELGEVVELVQETYFVGVTLTEVLPKTDVQILPNLFRNIVRGRSAEDSSNLELNLILTHRLVDRVNKLDRRQARRALGLAQWAVSLRFFEDSTVEGLTDFESRGLVFKTFIELFSGPANRSTFILEAVYELRDFHRLDEQQNLARFGLRLGL